VYNNEHYQHFHHTQWQINIKSVSCLPACSYALMKPQEKVVNNPFLALVRAKRVLGSAHAEQPHVLPHLERSAPHNPPPPEESPPVCFLNDPSREGWDDE
jgi:hypothetical protein